MTWLRDASKTSKSMQILAKDSQYHEYILLVVTDHKGVFQDLAKDSQYHEDLALLITEESSKIWVRIHNITKTWRY